MTLETSTSPTTNRSPIERSIRFLSDPAMQAVLLGSALIGILIYFLKIAQTIPAGNLTLTILYSVIFLGIVLVAFVRFIPIRIRYIIFLVLLGSLGAIDLFLGGLNSDGLLFLLIFVFMSALFFRARIGLVIAAIAILVIIFLGFAMVTGLLKPNEEYGILQSNSLFDWSLIGIIVLFGIIASFTGLYQLIPNLIDQFFAQKDQISTLEEENQSLLKSIDDASLSLQRKTSELAVASQIARNIALQQDPLSLIDNTLNSIRDQFGFYHAGLFFIDDLREYAVLKAATGEAGRIMLEQNHRLRIGEQGIVGFVAAHGVARIAADVGQDSVHFQNPLLPNTHSEMALPLRFGERVIGVLDVQSENAAAFTQQDVNIIQTIADQLAASIDHSRTVSELQRNLEEYQSSSQLLTQRDWAEFLAGLRTPHSIRYTNKGIQKSSGESGIVREAFESGQTEVKVRKSKSGKSGLLAIPVKLRNSTIGVIELKIDDPARVPEIQSLVESTASRLALSLENARLMEEMQIRMEQERMVADITSKVRSSTAINEILRETAVELGKSMGLSDVRVELRTKSNITEGIENQEKLG